MYLDFEVKIPEVQGKIGRFTKGGTIYVRYVTGRTYHPEKKYNIPNHKTIGKQSLTDQTMMIPNKNYLKYFGDVELSELKAGVNRSSCIRIGVFLVARKILEEYELPAIQVKDTKSIFTLKPTKRMGYSCLRENVQMLLNGKGALVGIL